MDENQRQDWWPDTHPEDFSRTSGQNDQPGDLPKNTAADTPGLNSDSEQSHNWDNNSRQDSNSQNSYDWNGSSYNSNPGSNWNTHNQPGGYYSDYPPRRSSGGPMVTASLVMGILSIVLMCCGLSYVFGALGIIFALLSRKDGPMDSQAKIGIGLSIAGSVIGIVIVAFAVTSNLSYYTDFMRQYQNFIYEHDDSGYFDFDDYDFDLDDYDLDDYGSHDDYNRHGDYDGYDGYNNYGYENYNYFKELRVVVRGADETTF